MSWRSLRALWRENHPDSTVRPAPGQIRNPIRQIPMPDPAKPQKPTLDRGDGTSHCPTCDDKGVLTYIEEDTPPLFWLTGPCSRCSHPAWLAWRNRLEGERVRATAERPADTSVKEDTLTHLKLAPNDYKTIELSKLCTCTDFGGRRAKANCGECEGRGEILTQNGQALMQFLQTNRLTALIQPKPEYSLDGPNAKGIVNILRRDGMCVAQFANDIPGGAKAAAEAALNRLLDVSEDGD